MKTKVIFRKFFDGDVIAFFPELPGTSDAGTCLNYMRIVGQHGTGQASCEGTKPASPEEYKASVDELTAIGYELVVVKRFTHQMYFKRVDQLRRAAK